MATLPRLALAAALTCTLGCAQDAELQDSFAELLPYSDFCVDKDFGGEGCLYPQETGLVALGTAPGGEKYASAYSHYCGTALMGYFSLTRNDSASLRGRLSDGTEQAGQTSRLTGMAAWDSERRTDPIQFNEKLDKLRRLGVLETSDLPKIRDLYDEPTVPNTPGAITGRTLLELRTEVAKAMLNVEWTGRDATRGECSDWIVVQNKFEHQKQDPAYETVPELALMCADELAFEPNPSPGACVYNTFEFELADVGTGAPLARGVYNFDGGTQALCSNVSGELRGTVTIEPNPAAEELEMFLTELTGSDGCARDPRTNATTCDVVGSAEDFTSHMVSVSFFEEGSEAGVMAASGTFYTDCRAEEP